MTEKEFKIILFELWTALIYVTGIIVGILGAIILKWQWNKCKI